MRKMPEDKHLGELGVDCLGGKKLTSANIKWTRTAPGSYETDPFRFILDKVPEDEHVYQHWKMSDCRVVASYHGSTAKACKAQAQEIIDIEQGRTPKPEPKKKRKPKAYKYEGLFVRGKRVDLETGEPIEDKPEPDEKRKGLFG